MSVSVGWTTQATCRLWWEIVQGTQRHCAASVLSLTDDALNSYEASSFSVTFFGESVPCRCRWDGPPRPPPVYDQGWSRTLRDTVLHHSWAQLMSH
jgi:hypothetical protein